MRNRATRSYEYNVLCDVCGFKMKASKLRRRWDGHMVCEKDWETRNPLDFYTTRNDAHLLPFTRPNNNGVDVGPQTALVNWGLASNGAVATGSSVNGGFVAAYANNGINYSSTQSWVDSQVGVFPKTLTIQLAAPKRISKVVIYCPQDDIPYVDPDINPLTTELWAINDYSVSVAEASGNMLYVAGKYGNTAVRTEVRFAPILTQTVVLSITKTSRTDGIVSVNEMQVWGEP